MLKVGNGPSFWPPRPVAKLNGIFTQHWRDRLHSLDLHVCEKFRKPVPGVELRPDLFQKILVGRFITVQCEIRPPPISVAAFHMVDGMDNLQMCT
jgi:hypothetical protein